jgi:hypothetical protein
MLRSLAILWTLQHCAKQSASPYIPKTKTRRPTEAPFPAQTISACFCLSATQCIRHCPSGWVSGRSSASCSIIWLIGSLCICSGYATQCFVWYLAPSSAVSLLVISSPRVSLRGSARQEVSYLFWNLKIHYCLYKNPTLFLQESDEASLHRPSLWKIHFDITLPSMPRSCKFSLSLT